MKADKVEYSSQLIHQLLEQAIKRFRWLEISVEDFLYDITHAVPFIQIDGNEYKWVHKSFMEYFSSCFICYDNKNYQEKYFEKMSCNSSGMKYFNVLDFCYDLDTLNFRKYNILPYLANCIYNFEHFFTNIYFDKMDVKDLYLAKHIFAFNNEIEIIFLDERKENFKERCDEIVIENIKENRNRNCLVNRNRPLNIFLYTTIRPSLYELMLNKIPELFINIEDTYFERLEYEGVIEVDYEKKIEFNDEISNPINADKIVFHNIVSETSKILYVSECKFFDIKKCKEMISQITTENKYINDNMFDL